MGGYSSNCPKLISTPSKALLFLSLPMTHINAKGTTFYALLFLLPLSNKTTGPSQI